MLFIARGFTEQAWNPNKHPNKCQYIHKTQNSQREYMANLGILIMDIYIEETDMKYLGTIYHRYYIDIDRHIINPNISWMCVI